MNLYVPSVWNRISCRHKFNVRYDIFPDILQYVHETAINAWMFGIDHIVKVRNEWWKKASVREKKKQFIDLLKMQCLWKESDRNTCNAVESGMKRETRISGMQENYISSPNNSTFFSVCSLFSSFPTVCVCVFIFPLSFCYQRISLCYKSQLLFWSIACVLSVHSILDWNSCFVDFPLNPPYFIYTSIEHIEWNPVFSSEVDKTKTNINKPTTG